MNSQMNPAQGYTLHMTEFSRCMIRLSRAHQHSWNGAEQQGSCSAGQDEDPCRNENRRRAGRCSQLSPCAEPLLGCAAKPSCHRRRRRRSRCCQQ